MHAWKSMAYWYQEEFANLDGNRALVGGRQVGKTRAIVDAARADGYLGRDVCVVAPTHQNLMDIGDRLGFSSYSDQPLGNGSVSFRHPVRLGGAQYDVIYVDEFQSTNLTTDIFDSFVDADIAVTGTPTPAIENSPFKEFVDECNTVIHVPVYDAPHIEFSRMEEYSKRLTNDGIRSDVFGLFAEEGQ